MVTYSDVEGGWPGEGNIDADPLFVGGDDFHLRTGSPCIDAGADAGVYTDTDGDVRPYGAGFDMGADEYTGPRWAIEIDASYDAYAESSLSLAFIVGTPEPAIWSTSLFLMFPTIQWIPLWAVPMPVIDPPIDIPSVFPFPSLGMICITTGVYADLDLQPEDSDFVWVDTLCPDTDEDGYDDENCGGDDCDDSDPNTYPEATDPCDGVDQDCDGKDGIDELCNGEDDDCDGTVPEDEDDDDGDGWMICKGDCDDSSPAAHPFAIEGPESDPTCSDGLDNDCDGSVDGADYGCTPTHVMSTLPDTGIEQCYIGSYPEISCPDPGEPYYGQDAQYVTNRMSFTDHGDGTVIDNVTGLMWQQEDDDVKRDWYGAINYCGSLDLAGHTDWRLPDEYELQAIVDYGRGNPTIDTTYFPGTDSSGYWSVSPIAEYAWQATFRHGIIQLAQKDSPHGYVRCVRGESTERSFTDNGDGTVTDNVAGLMWQQENQDVSRIWESALSYCESLELAGYADWRLPDIKELRSLVDNTKYDPAIDTTYFLYDGGSTDFFWSSSTKDHYHIDAVGVVFKTGAIDDSAKRHGRCVRCVR